MSALPSRPEPHCDLFESVDGSFKTMACCWEVFLKQPTRVPKSVLESPPSGKAKKHIPTPEPQPVSNEIGFEFNFLQELRKFANTDYLKRKLMRYVVVPFGGGSTTYYEWREKNKYLMVKDWDDGTPNDIKDDLKLSLLVYDYEKYRTKLSEVAVHVVQKAIDIDFQGIILVPYDSMGQCMNIRKAGAIGPVRQLHNV